MKRHVAFGMLTALFGLAMVGGNASAAAPTPGHACTAANEGEFTGVTQYVSRYVTRTYFYRCTADAWVSQGAMQCTTYPSYGCVNL